MKEIKEKEREREREMNELGRETWTQTIKRDWFLCFNGFSTFVSYLMRKYWYYLTHTREG